MKKALLGIVAALCFAVTAYAQTASELNITETFSVRVSSDKVLNFGIADKYIYQLNSKGEYEMREMGRERVIKGLKPVSVTSEYAAGSEDPTYVIFTFKDAKDKMYIAHYYFNDANTQRIDF